MTATAGAKPAGTRALIQRFASYYRPYRRLFLLDFTCAVISGLLELGFPVAVGLFVDRLLPDGDWTVIIVAAAALAAIYIANAGLMIIVTYWGHVLGINIETDMRRQAFDHLQKLSFGYFDNQKTGHIIGRVTKDLEEVGEVAHHGPEDTFIAIMTLVGAFALMFAIHPQLAFITALVVPIVLFVTMRFGSQMTVNFRQLFARVGSFNARIEENVGGIRVVQAFANEDHERRLFAIDNENYRGTKKRAYRLMTMTMTLSYLSMRITQLVVLVAGSYYIFQGSAVQRRLRQLPAAGQRLLPANREDQQHPGAVPQGHRRLPALLRPDRHRPGHRRPARRDRRRRFARRHPLRAGQLRLQRWPARPDRPRPRHPGRRDDRLRRAVRRRQDDDLRAAAPLLRRHRRPDHD